MKKSAHFPDTDQLYKDIDSKILLRKTNEILHAKGYELINIDSSICLEKPKVKPHIEAMQQAISSCLDIDVDYISIKATTTEKLGFVGREEGIVAHASVLVKKKEA